MEASGWLRLSAAGVVAVLAHGALLPPATRWSQLDQTKPTPPPENRDAVEPPTPEPTPPDPQALRPDVFISAVGDLPALTVGQAYDLAYELTNAGNASASTPDGRPWTTRVLLSKDLLPSGDDGLIDELALASLEPGDWTTREATFTVNADTLGLGAGQTMPGEAWLLLIADADDALDEGPGEKNNLRALRVELREAVDGPKLGRQDREPRVTVAWIDHEAFEELQARQGSTLQPALQNATEPTPGAPMIADAGAAQPLAEPQEPQEPAPPQEAQQEQADQLVEQTPKTAQAEPPPAVIEGETPEQPGELAMGERTEEPLPSQDAPVKSQEPSEPPTQQASQSAQEAQEAREARQASDQPALPTSMPKSEAEADAVTLLKPILTRPGAVRVSEGLELLPSRPRFSAVTQASTLAVVDPIARVTFDRDGTVLEAVLLRSSGAPNVDGPLRESLYRWKARGEQLQQWDAPRTFEFSLLLSSR